MKQVFVSRRDGACQVHLEVPETASEFIAALEEMPEEHAMECCTRAWKAWIDHSAPKAKKGVAVDISYGTEKIPLSFAEMLKLAAETTRREAGPSKLDMENAEEWFAPRRIGWRRENPAVAKDGPEELAAFQAIVEGRAAANRAKNFPALEWEWQEGQTAIVNLATMERALRFYGKDAR